MSNRFVVQIRSGGIDTVADLKLLFRRLAKETHPDLASRSGGDAGTLEAPGSEATGAGFIRLREEYDRALAEFDRHRYGAARDSHLVVDRAALYLALEALFGRSFPKTPKHEKEKLRYEYARFAFLENLKAYPALGGEGAFEGFEAGLFAMRRDDPDDFAAARAWVARLMEYHRSGVEALIVELRLGLRERAPGAARGSGGLSFFPTSPDSRRYRGVMSFLDALARDIDLGPALAGSGRGR